MDIILLGIIREDRPKQLNAQSPIEVTLLGNVVLLHANNSVFEDVSIIALHLFRES